MIETNPYKNIIKRFHDGTVLQITCAELKEIIYEEKNDAIQEYIQLLQNKKPERDE